MACLCLVLTVPAFAGGRPEGVVVVVNEDSWASLAVANEYIRLRNIPPLNVVYLPLGDLPDFEIVDVNTFRSRILGPVLETIHDRGLDDTVDCVVYSADLPYAVTVGKDTQGLKLPTVITPIASINGLTYLCQYVMSKEPTKYLSLGINWYARRVIRTAAKDDPRWSAEQMTRFGAAIKFMQDKKWDQAEPILHELLATHSNSPDLHYNMACCLAQQGKIEDGIAELRMAVQRGWWERLRTESDEELKPLRKHRDFASILADIKPLSADRIQPPRGFRGRYQWRQDGERAFGLPGPRFLLSTMLAVTSGRGNSVSEAMESLRRAASADATYPVGTIYYMANDNIRSKTRQYGFEAAVARLAELSVKAEVVKGFLPEKRVDVAGIMAGSADFDWGKSGSVILPGAICEHLTSTGGEMVQQAGQTPISEWIRHGSAGTSGAVTEPYAITNKFPSPFIHCYYASGCTLAESFYLSLAGPYQLLIVGDPLCRPWARVPKVTLGGVAPMQSVKGKLTIQPGVADPNGFRVAAYEFFMDGRRIGMCQPDSPFTLATTEMCDGWHELRVTATGADAIETQGELIVPVVVANGPDVGMKVTADNPQPMLGGSVTFAVKCPGATSIVLMHNSRELTVVEGAEGFAKIDTRRLGLGKVRVQGLAKNSVGKTLASAAPVEIEVTLPSPLAATDAKWESLSPGLKVTLAGKKPETINDLKHLADAGMKKDEAFVLEGYFTVPADGMYQIQAHVPGQARFRVDAMQLGGGDAARAWQFMPMNLSRGVHLLRCEATLSELRMDVRLGGPGAKSIAAPAFRH